ncbi:MAG: hypothetical protein JNL92_06470 [Opitutaceae bacterium]|nr:hypothetical protein [Opitutaceae bacterium]
MTEPERRRPAPILLGIVGHTELRPEDHAALSTAIRSILDDVRTRFPSTPLAVVSSLAEGADQLCADVALAAGVAVIAPLPFPAPLYRTRFKSAAARHHLDTLVRHPEVTAFCPVLGGEAGPDFAAELADDTRRRRRYAETAIFVARNAHALIALWEGREAAAPSLTAQLIDFKTLGRPVDGPAQPGPSPEVGPVFSIFAPRVGTPAADPAPGTMKILAPASLVRAAPDLLFRQVFADPRPWATLAPLLPGATER